MYVSPIQTNFTAGELSPRLRGRVDLSKYNNGCEQLLNMVVHPHGGASRRSGTYFCNEVRYSSRVTRLIPFKFSTVQAYILEFGHNYIRFYRNNGIITSGGSPYQITTPWTEADLEYLKFTQSADILYVAHPDYPIKKISRTGHTSWTITDFDNQDGPYLDTNITSTTLTPSAASGTITVTASAVTGINSGQGFLTTDVGRLVRIKNGSGWAWGKITARASTTSITVEVKGGTMATTAQKDWRLGSWSDSTGWPYCVTFHEERFIAGGTDTEPFKIWMSKSGDFENFGPTALSDSAVADDDGVTYALVADDVNSIKALSSGKKLCIFTSEGEFTLDSGSTTDPISPTKVQAKRETKRGSTDVPPIRIDEAVLFLQRSGRKVREFAYSFEKDNYVAPDMSLLSEHITLTGLYEMAYQQEPDSVVWATRGDGKLIGLTYQRDQEVIAWHPHEVGGSYQGGHAVVESVASIPSSDGTRDELWVIVLRTINGQTKRYVEYLTKQFDSDVLQEESFFVDSGLSYNGTAAQTFGGLTHLEGETLDILADGAVHPPVTVTGGSVTLNYKASIVHMGLHYRSKLKDMPPEAAVHGGTMQGKVRRVHKANIKFHDTLGCKFGPDEDNLEEISFRSFGDAMDTAPPLFSGDVEVNFSAGYEGTGQILIVQDQPLPMSVLTIVKELHVYG